MTGPRSVAAERLANRGLIRDHTSLWDTLSDEYGYSLNKNVKKHRNSPGFVLEAVRGKGKKRSRFHSCKLKLVFKTKKEARSIESAIKFGDSLLSTLQVKRKRFRGTVECEHRSHSWDSSTVRKKSQKQMNQESFAKRLCKRAASNGIEDEVFAATKGYTDFRCIGNLQKKGAVSNFLRRLKNEQVKEKKRSAVSQLYKEHAQYLRRGLAAGTVRNFVRHRDDDENDDVASS